MPNNHINNLRDVIKEEFKKCLTDPIYFMKKYVKIQHPHRGTIPFELYPFQEDTLKNLIANRFNLILKSRQMGITTLISAYALWLMIFHSDKNVLIISIKQEVSKEIVTKVRFANDKLPSWLKVVAEEDNRLSLRLKNGSQIKATSSSGDAGRSSALSLLVIDEAAFIDNASDIWTSARPTLSTGGNAIILSTPNGVGNWFHKMWIEAENKKNDFTTIKLPWHLHPERDQRWRDEQTKDLGPAKASQECDCDFLTSGANLIDLQILSWYEKEQVREPSEMRWANNLWIFDPPIDGKEYIVSADVARGDGSDYSAAHVIELETLTQVAEVMYQSVPKDFGNHLVSLSTEYNDALLIVERENIGWAVLQQIIDRDYGNTFYSSTDLKYKDVKRQLNTKFNAEEKKCLPGFSTTTTTRPLIISKLEAYFREKVVNVRSVRLINQLKTFVWENGKAQAAPNYNDDLVIALGLGLWVRDISLKLREEGIYLTKTMLDKIRVVKSEMEHSPIYSSKDVHSNAQSQWNMKLGIGNDKTEKLDWLL